MTSSEASGEMMEGADGQLRPRTRADLIARAWEMHATDSLSTRDIAARLGISPATAWRYVKEGQAAEVYTDLLERQLRRQSAAHRLDWYRSTLLQEYKIGGAALMEILPHLRWIEEREAKLLALDVPATLRIDMSEGPTPSADVAAAIMAAKAAASQREKALDVEFTTDQDT